MRVLKKDRKNQLARTYPAIINIKIAEKILDIHEGIGRLKPWNRIKLHFLSLYAFSYINFRLTLTVGEALNYVDFVTGVGETLKQLWQNRFFFYVKLIKHIYLYN